MVSEWSRVPISKVAYAVIGGTPSRKVPEYWHGDVPWATAKDVASVSGRYLNHVEEYITKEGLQNSAAKLLSKGTVVITARGTVGAVAQLGRDMAFNQTCYAILPKNNLDNNFLFYALKGTMIEMRALTYGTVFETITINTFDHWLIPLPPLPVQRAIAHILGTLDDKIELNRKINETLEQMARALFKCWFIDFEPVRAKMEGRWKKGQSLPGLPAHLYDFFPDRLVRTEFGEIPEGWHQKKLENIIDFKKGKKPSIVYQKPRAESLPVILIESFDRDPNIYSDPEGMVLADYDDVLMVMDGASSGRVETGQRGIVGSTIAKVILNDYNLSKQFIYYFLKFIEPISRKHLTGTSIPHSDKRWILSHILYLPDDKILLKEFENIAITFRTKINLNNKECWNLVLMRDSLLPKLINGQIRVKDAEIFLKEGGL